jgi:hypothetical protein
MQKEEGANHNGNHGSNTIESKTIEEIFIYMPHMWFE